MPTRDTRRWGWWGIVFVVAFVAAIAAGNALANTSLYLPGASVAELRAFYTGSSTAVLVQSALQILAAVALYRFGRGAAPGPALRAVTVGTASTSGFLLLSALLSLVMLVEARSAGTGSVRSLATAILLSGGALHLLGLALLITAASAAAEPGAPWMYRYGRIVGPVLALSVVSIAWQPLIRAEPALRLLGAVWIVAMGVAALRGREGVTASA